MSGFSLDGFIQGSSVPNIIASLLRKVKALAPHQFQTRPKDDNEKSGEPKAKNP
jgi:hypothetical protein